MLLSPYSVDAQVAMGSYNPLGPLSGGVFGTLINAAKETWRRQTHSRRNNYISTTTSAN